MIKLLRCRLFHHQTMLVGVRGPITRCRDCGQMIRAPIEYHETGLGWIATRAGQSECFAPAWEVAVKSAVLRRRKVRAIKVAVAEP
jgi:hypothetical protein